MSVDYAEVFRLAKRGRKAEQRGKALRKFIEGVIAQTLVALFTGWMFMLAVEVAHNHWWPAVPGIGYWWAFLIALLLPGVFTRTSTRKDDA